MKDEQTKFEGHAIVELMGHNTIAGYVSEQVIAGSAMLRVDVPATDEQPAYTKFFGGAAIYAVTPTTEEIAARAAARFNVRPINEWTLPDRALRPALVDGLAGPDTDTGEHEEDDSGF